MAQRDGPGRTANKDKGFGFAVISVGQEGRLLFLREPYCLGGMPFSHAGRRLSRPRVSVIHCRRSFDEGVEVAGVAVQRVRRPAEAWRHVD